MANHLPFPKVTRVPLMDSISKSFRNSVLIRVIQVLQLSLLYVGVRRRLVEVRLLPRFGFLTDEVKFTCNISQFVLPLMLFAEKRPHITMLRASLWEWSCWGHAHDALLFPNVSQIIARVLDLFLMSRLHCSNRVLISLNAVRH